MATPEPPPALISSIQDVHLFLSSIPQSSTLYLDLEGSNLDRNGTLSAVTVLVYPTRVTSLIDVQTLGDSAFTTASSGGNTFKALLEDPNVPKCLWDVRNDAEVLWAYHQVRLAGVVDVQFLENATRAGDKTYLHGLERCVDREVRMTGMESYHWCRTKQEVKALMSSSIFARRPLGATSIQYCVNDVTHLPELRDVYTKKIDGR